MVAAPLSAGGRRCRCAITRPRTRGGEEEEARALVSAGREGRRQGQTWPARVPPGLALARCQLRSGQPRALQLLRRRMAAAAAAGPRLGRRKGEEGVAAPPQASGRAALRGSARFPLLGA